MSRSFADLHTAAIGSPAFLGVIDVTTTSKRQDQATAAFSTSGTALASKTLLVHASAACFIAPVASSGTVTAANGVPLGADEKAVITMLPSDTHLAAITASGTANLKVWELRS
jgi:hypothetical protein